MDFRIDTLKQEIVLPDGRIVSLYSPEGFRLLSQLWLKVGWDQKYVYSFAWLGRPIIQLPEDMMRIQEVIYRLKPDVIIETGIAHGGSLIFYASLCKAMGKGRVIGVDIEIRPHNREAIEAHELYPFITMIGGSSVDPAVVMQVKNLLKSGETALVILDSNHTYDHVRAELELYSPMVSAGSYIVATDGSMEFIHDVPRAQKEYPRASEWTHDNPKKAAEDFMRAHSEFVFEEPRFPFNEGDIDFRITHWPNAYLKRVR